MVLSDDGSPLREHNTDESAFSSLAASFGSLQITLGAIASAVLPLSAGGRGSRAVVLDTDRRLAVLDLARVLAARALAAELASLLGLSSEPTEGAGATDSDAAPPSVTGVAGLGRGGTFVGSQLGGALWAATQRMIPRTRRAPGLTAGTAAIAPALPTPPPAPAARVAAAPASAPAPATEAGVPATVRASAVPWADLSSALGQLSQEVRGALDEAVAAVVMESLMRVVILDAGPGAAELERAASVVEALHGQGLDQVGSAFYPLSGQTGMTFATDDGGGYQDELEGDEDDRRGGLGSGSAVDGECPACARRRRGLRSL
jgi:hypothetical protein